MAKKSRKNNKPIIFSVILVLALILLVFLLNKNESRLVYGEHQVVMDMPIGNYYTSFIDSMPCGMVLYNGSAFFDNCDVFKTSSHYYATLLWFGKDGFLAYNVSLPNITPIDLRIFMEVSSEAPLHNENYPSDLSIYINKDKYLTYNINGDYGGEYPRYMPQNLKNWNKDYSQHGEPLLIEINDFGTFIVDKKVTEKEVDDWLYRRIDLPLKRVSDKTIKGIDMSNMDFVLSIDKDSQHVGGLNVYGKRFGNYAHGIVFSISFNGLNISTPRMMDILNNPKKFNNSLVLLRVSSSGWSCKYESTNPLDFLSRSAVFWTDGTACMYSNGFYVVNGGKLDRFNSDQELLILARIKLYKGIPYLDMP